MPLEACMVCIDNSEWMRNGDFSPNRFQAQLDAVNLLCGNKTNQNLENTVGIVSFGGKSCEVLAALTGDLGKVLAALHRVQIGGTPKFSSGIQIAQLALKHRPNKRQEQKIVIFVGSPITESEAELKRLGTRLKKNKVGVDVVNFGEEAENTAKLEAFVNAVNSTDNNSHLVTVPAGPHILADILISSPIIGGDVGAGDGGLGVDPNVDPELALALRLSLEESQRSEPPPPGVAPTGGDSKPASTTPSIPTPLPHSTGDIDMEMGDEEEGEDEDDEQALLAQAIAMSMGQGGTGPIGSRLEDVEMSEEDELQLALQLSMQDSENKPVESSKSEEDVKSSDDNIAEAAKDAELMQSILSNLPGVDPNDPNLKNLLDSLKESEKDDKK